MTVCLIVSILQERVIQYKFQHFLFSFYLTKNDLTFIVKNNEYYHQLPSLLLMIMQCYSIQEINQTHLRRYLHEWT